VNWVQPSEWGKACVTQKSNPPDQAVLVAGRRIRASYKSINGSESLLHLGV